MNRASVRLSDGSFGGCNTSSHPRGSRSLCVRANGPDALVIWDNGYLQIPIEQVPFSWQAVVDGSRKTLPVRIRRPILSGLMGVRSFDVEYL